MYHNPTAAARGREAPAPRRQASVPPPATAPVVAPAAIEATHGRQPARVRRRGTETITPAALLAVVAWLRGMRFPTPLLRWWREHDPLLMQRLLLVIALVLAVLVTLQVFGG